MCVTVAILMHWFVLSVFSWILVEEIQLYLSVQFGWSRDSTRFKYFLVLGWRKWRLLIFFSSRSIVFLYHITSSLFVLYFRFNFRWCTKKSFLKKKLWKLDKFSDLFSLLEGRLLRKFQLDRPGWKKPRLHEICQPRLKIKSEVNSGRNWSVTFVV